MRELEILTKKIAREKRARKEAETIAEMKSRVLYHKNRELIELSNDLADKEKNTRAILEATADGIIVLNNSYDVIGCNQAACQLFDYQADELQGKNITRLITFVAFQKATQTLASFFEQQKENVLYEFTALRRDKTTLPVELAISKVELTQSLSIVCVVRNIFERKQAEQRLAVQHQMVRTMVESNSLDELTPKILKIICETMQLEAGALWRIDRANKILRCINIWNIDDDEEVKKFTEISHNEITFSMGIGLPGRVWESKKPCWINDVTQDANFPRSPWAKKAGLKSAFGFPILIENEVFGVLEFFMKSFYPNDQNIIHMLNDISNQLGIFIEREQAQKRVAVLSRLTGMSEVASSVLHNVGNTLNSINTSIELINTKVNQSSMKNLCSLTTLLQQNKDDITAFFINDPRGQRVPDFISLLSEEWSKEKQYVSNELRLLTRNVEQVKKIIGMQQSLSYTLGATEEVSITELLEDALVLNKIAYEHAEVNIICDFIPVKKINTDRVKLLQIIVNLVKNGIDALLHISGEDRRLSVRLCEKDDSFFMIQVTDNGVGIPSSNLTRIFSHGFTTKVNGHGFGLHTSALFAQDLGGSLNADSQGIGFGATFTLILPYQPQLKRKK